MMNPKTARGACFMSGAIAPALLLAGCATSDPGAAFNGIGNEVSRRAGTAFDVRWNRDPAADAAAQSAVKQILARGPLTADRAARIAVLNNRSLQASFEEIGISHAEYVQAGMLGNPEFSTSLRFPDRAPSALNAEYALAANLVDLFLIPARRQVAARELDRAKTRAASEVLGLIADTKIAVYTLQARQQLLERQRLISQTNDAAADLARRLHDAGNITDLALDTQQAAAAQSQVDTLQTQTMIRSDSERLNRLLGFFGPEAGGWKVAGSLPPIPAREHSGGDLETFAAARRLDLQTARANVDAIGQALALRTKTRYLPASITLGVDTEREPDRQHVTGPTLDLELPIFDQGQGAIAKLAAQYRQAKRLLEAAEINARSEVREAQAMVVASRTLAQRYSETLLPQQRRILEQTQVQYNAMQNDGFDLLNARERELGTERAHLEAWRDYWIARAQLERALNGGSGEGFASVGAEISSGRTGVGGSASTRAAAAKSTGH